MYGNHTNSPWAKGSGLDVNIVLGAAPRRPAATVLIGKYPCDAVSGIREADCAGQGCEARGLATLSQEQGRMRGGDPSAYGGPPTGSIMHVDGPVRPWGKRSKALPLAAGRTRGPAVRGRY